MRILRKQTHTKALILLATLAALNVFQQVVARQLCDGVGFLPTQLIPTGAKDMARTTKDDDSFELIDVHTYNHFYTFQIDRDAGKVNEGIEMLIPSNQFSTSSEGLAFRLRAEFNSAEASRTEMGFKVTLFSQDKDKKRTSVKEASSLDGANGIGTALIDAAFLPSGFDYVLRYEFYAKEIIRRGSSLSSEEDTIASRDWLVNCNLPFFTQELALVDRKVLRSRVRKFLQTDQNSNVLDISKLSCEFKSLAASDNVEGGLACEDREHTYASAVKKQKTGPRMVAEFPLSVAGKKGRPTTHYFQLNIGTEFVFGAGLRALVRRKDGPDSANPYECLLDQSCQISKRNEKNHVSLNIVLTSGDYLLQFFDHSESQFADFVFNELGLENTPISISVEAYPILQSEERSTCPYMYLTQDFIQNKFITGQEGQRFFFSDKMVIDLVNLEQRITIFPEQDSFLKVFAREAFGVNLQIKLCKIQDNGQADCSQVSSKQIGNIEMLTADLRRRQGYYIKLIYTDSVLAFHSYKECPHLLLELSLISKDEAKQLATNTANLTGLKTQADANKVFDTFNEMQKPMKLHTPSEATYKIDRTKEEFQVLASSQFQNDVKIGIFVEIFNSPFAPEVLGLHLESNTNSGLTLTNLNRYKSAKSIWVDLEPGSYTLQVICATHPDDFDADAASVTFQLYLRVDYINVARNSFIPKSLNYMGLLGHEQETKDFGQITLFYDDVVVLKPKRAIYFQVQSEIASVSIQIEQDENVQYGVLLLATNDKGKTEQVGKVFTDHKNKRKLTSTQLDLIVPGQLYEIQITQDATKSSNVVETSELGEKYNHSFSLKIEFSENDSDKLAPQLRRNANNKQLGPMEDFAKVKLANPGMREAAFKIGTREINSLMESPDQAMKDMSGYIPYLPKDTRIYTTLSTDKQIVDSIPFVVDTDAEIFYAGIYEYTQGSNLLSLSLFSEETQAEIVISEQGKFYSRIPGAILNRGKYYLGVKNDKSKRTNSQKTQAPIQYMLDVVRLQISATHKNEFIEALQLCPLPDSPQATLNKIGYVHPLSGNNMQSTMQFKIMELDSGVHLPLRVNEPALINVYIEVPKNVHVTLGVKETGGLRKVVALSSDQDKTTSNFLKQQGFKEKHVVSLRAVLAPGVYWIEAQANSFENSNVNFDEMQDFCQTYTISLSVSGTKSAEQAFFGEATQEEYCLEVSSLPQKLEMNAIKRGDFIADLSKKDMTVAYFNPDNDFSIGPYLVYFQLDYDMSQEGPVAVVLSKYDSDALLWYETGVYRLSDSQSVVLEIVTGGTYGISVQPIDSTPLKFNNVGIYQSNLLKTKTFASGCFRAKYTYFVTSVNPSDREGQSSSLFNTFFGKSENDMVREVIALETTDDMRDLTEFTGCKADELPKHWPESGNFEEILTLRISEQKYDIVDIIVPEDSYLKAELGMRDDKTVVQIFVIDDADSKDINTQHALASTSIAEETLTVTLKGRKKAYRMKIVYVFVPDDNNCVLYNLHVALKPFDEIASQNLLCEGNVEPPELFEINSNFYKFNQTYSFSGEYLMSQNLKQYDFILEFDHSDYFLDVQLKTDFLTNEINMEAYIRDEETLNFKKIAESEIVNTEKRGMQQYLLDNRSRVVKLRYLEEIDPEAKLSSASTIILRLVIAQSNKELLNILKTRGYFDPKNSPVCFNFDFNLLAIEEKKQVVEVTTEDASNLNPQDIQPTLLRVQFSGPRIGAGKFLAKDKIYCDLEFDLPITSETYKSLKESNTFHLQPIFKDSEKKQNTAAFDTGVVMPKEVKLLNDNNTIYRLRFHGSDLKSGRCYKLVATGLLLPVVIEDEMTDSTEMKICTSACACSTVGSMNCIEDEDSEPVCVCKPHFTGDFCSECTSGYVKNQKGECVMGNLCVADGGLEDCNGHGECFNNNGLASCICDEGFDDDGLSLCGRCADPMFIYPHECQKMQRQYAIVQDNYECSKMPYQMPSKLYKDENEEDQAQEVYERQGIISWKGRYSLYSASASHSKASKTNKHSKIRKLSEHEFLVVGTSIVRVYLNTLNSGARFRYSIMDSNQRLVMGGGTYTELVVEFDKLKPVSGENQYKPFKLIIEYDQEFEEHQQCPIIEVNFSLTPVRFQQKSLKCTESQKNEANNFNNKLTFYNVNKIKQEKVTISSDSLSDDTVKAWESLDAEFLYTDIEIEVTEPGHALSAFVSYQFDNMHATLTLRQDERVLYVEKTGLLGEVEDSVEVYTEMQSRSSPLQNAPAFASSDMMSFIEVPVLDVGKYTLQVGVPIGNFLKSSQYSTCLEYDLVIEYISRRKMDENYDPDVEAPIQVLSINPPSAKQLSQLDKLDLQLIFDREIDTRAIASNQAELNRACTLQYAEGGPLVLVPEHTFFHQNFATLNFASFYNMQILVSFLKNNKVSEVCFKLVCQTEKGKHLVDFLPIDEQIGGNYCVQNNDESKNNRVSSLRDCNGFAKPKFENGRCICTFPYNGETCDLCQDGFNPIKIKLNSKPSQKEETATQCEPAKGSEWENCNGFGRYSNNSKSCTCDNLHAGFFCEECKDQNMEYPDCVNEQKSKTTSSDVLRDYEQRRRSQVYNVTDHLRYDVDNVFTQQCAVTNYPTFLNEIHAHKEFVSGDFHISDFFVTNHDADNVIQFTPKTEGFFKIMVKQPEAFTATSIEETMDFEVGVQIQGQDKFIKVETNFDIEFQGRMGRQRADFTTLFLDITDKLVDQPLLIFFRGTNYTHDELWSSENECQTLYLELEFRSKETKYVCSKDFPDAKRPKSITRLSADDDGKISTQGIVSQNDQSAAGFFYYQDYFIESNDDSENDLTITLTQKFGEEVTIVPIIEVLGLEQEEPDLAKNPQTPNCQISCDYAGHKSYNEMMLNIVVPFGTQFRVWLYKRASSSSCLNYQLKVSHNVIRKKSEEAMALTNLRCEHLADLPQTLNTERYLGVEGHQKDFEYVEQFRIDQVSSNIVLPFSLDEDTLVRFQGIEHKSIKFSVELYKGSQLIGAPPEERFQLDEGVHEPESSVFASLAPGDYKLKIRFVNAQMDVIQQPCQFIQLHMAMARLASLSQYDNSDLSVEKISLSRMLESSNTQSHNFEYSASLMSQEKQAYDIVYQALFSFEKKEGINIVITSTSDFLRLDINFVLVNTRSSHMYSPQYYPSEDKKKLLIQNVAGGKYKLYVYTRRLDQKSSSKVPLLNRFRMRIELYSFEETQKTIVKEIPDSGTGKNKIEVDQIFMEPDHFMCMAKYHQLPLDLLPNTLSQGGDFMIKFAVQSEEIAFGHVKTIGYTVPKGKDVLRLQVSDRIKINLYKEYDYKHEGEPLYTSIQINGQLSELVATGLESSAKYTIELVFGDFDQITCIHGSLQVLIVSSNEIKSKLADQGDAKTFELSTASPTDSSATANLVGTNGSRLQSSPQYTIQIKEDSTDLEIAADYSTSLYAANIQLVNADQNIKNMDEIFNLIDLHPSNIVSKKHQLKFTFSSLKAGKYYLRVLMPSKKEADFEGADFINVQLKVSLSHDKMMSQSQFHLHENKKYQSQQLGQDTARRIPVQLPIDLNSFKYLGGGSNEKSYLLVSELVKLHENDADNRITIKVDNAKTLVRVYFEDANLAVKISSSDSSKGSYGNSNVMQLVAGEGTHSFKFEHFTEQAKKKRLIFNDYVQVTILVAEPDFIEKQYKAQMKDALKACEDSAFPLALAKNIKVNAAEEQSYYLYPLVRMMSDYDGELAQYSFRFNETQRVFFEVGSNFLQSHAVLRWTTKPNRGNSYIFGKQRGNVNVLDLIVPAGDYQMTIMNFNVGHDPCNVYSLKGLLNQMSAMVTDSQIDTRGFLQGANQCEIRGDVLPDVIYQSKDIALGGNEEFINDSGVYFKAFESVLIAKDYREVLSPWTHEIQLSVTNQSLLKVVLQAEFANKMSVQVVTSMGQDVRPNFERLVEPQTNFEAVTVKELSYIFNLSPYYQHFIVFEFFGEAWSGGEDDANCEYFNLMLSIQSLAHLYNQFDCQGPLISKYQNLKNNWDQEIKQGIDFNSGNDYALSGFYTLAYPDDFSTDGASAKILLAQKIKTDSVVEVGGLVIFDVPFSDWQISLFNMPTSKPNKEASGRSQIQMLADGGLLQRDNVSSALSSALVWRHMNPTIVSPKEIDGELNLTLVLYEEQSPFVLKTISDYADQIKQKRALCLPLFVSLNVTQHEAYETTQKIAQGEILDFKFLHGDSSVSSNADDSMGDKRRQLPRTTKFVEVVLQLSSMPARTRSLKKAITLNILQNNIPLQEVEPKDVTIQQEQGKASLYTLRATFEMQLQKLNNINEAERATLTVSVDPDQILMQDDESQSFTMSSTLSAKFKKWYISVQSSAETASKDEIKKKSQGAKIAEEPSKKKDEEKKVVKKVKCLCVNGTCAEGEFRCNKCNPGFEGVLCDIRKQSYNRTGLKHTIEDASEVDDAVFNKDRRSARISDDDEDHQTKSETVVTPKYTEIKKEQPILQEEPQISLEQLYSRQQQGFLSKLFFGFVYLVKMVLWISGGLCGLFALYYLANIVKERASREELAKQRKQGRKKHESDYEGADFSDEGEDDESELVNQNPIELTSISKPNSSRKRSKKQQPNDLEARHVQQDLPMAPLNVQEQTQPQDSSWNPFDAEEDQEIRSTPTPEVKQGEAIIGEIDDILKDMSDSDEDNEFQSFV